MKPQKPEWTVPVPVCLKSLHQPTSITTHTIVMQWGTQFHIGFIYHYNLIHLTSIGDAAALLWSNGHCHMILRGGDGSEETFIHRRCLQLARWWLEYDPLWWKGRFRPTSAQCPQVGAFRRSLSILLLFRKHDYINFQLMMLQKDLRCLHHFVDGTNTNGMAI